MRPYQSWVRTHSNIMETVRLRFFASSILPCVVTPLALTRFRPYNGPMVSARFPTTEARQRASGEAHAPRVLCSAPRPTHVPVGEGADQCSRGGCAPPRYTGTEMPYPTKPS